MVIYNFIIYLIIQEGNVFLGIASVTTKGIREKGLVCRDRRKVIFSSKQTE
ncbi:hypothetical protein RU99_GL000325 [Enterococcus casseliflavus]|nr:hypothetical protein RU99_GL000325 [Enterococcus casseliflavus]